ncbi:MAG: 50S ribosomal protein L15 [Candidatus Omnitrophica bacterium]|nr:50S ribosomal protein L15 [Candidatus Omnitrophota bacterium]
MKIEEVRPSKGARRRPKRRGFGIGSGHGKTSGRGTKGQGARTGFSIPPWFEGGQMPLVRRIPKRGFHNRSRVACQVVNIKDLNRISVEEVTPEVLLKEKMIERADRPVKILGEGELKEKKRVLAHYFSSSAVEKIQKAGGTIEKVKR